jgi:hypothetical protein
MNEFTEQTVKIPANDHDVHIIFPNGKEITIQVRPSNADVNYNGSLDIVLPENQAVTMWYGDDMEPAPQLPGHPEIRSAKQLVMEMPWELDSCDPMVERLSEILLFMNIPDARRELTTSNIRWLARNLFIHNFKHELFPEAKVLLKSLLPNNVTVFPSESI